MNDSLITNIPTSSHSAHWSATPSLTTSCSNSQSPSSTHHSHSPNWSTAQYSAYLSPPTAPSTSPVTPTPTTPPPATTETSTQPDDSRSHESIMWITIVSSSTTSWPWSSTLSTWSIVAPRPVPLPSGSVCVHLRAVRALADLSLIHIWRCRRSTLCRSRWSPYH